MDPTAAVDRRQLLATIAGLGTAGVLAGCSESGDTGAGNDSTTNAETDDTASNTAGLDLREANIVDVGFEASGRSYSFDVTLHHDDDGEDGYANWWQIERLDGSQLGRRALLHAHSAQPFTRSETIEIPDDVRCVVVRGHDQTHGYGGQAMVVALDSGEVQAVDQGSERQPVDESDCP